MALFLGPGPAAAQAPLYHANDETTVRDLSFRFVDSQTFEASRLKEQIATQAPTFLAGLRNTVSFLPGLRRRAFPFDPITLQKDVVRLRRFYQDNGFPAPQIDYPASQLDTTDNDIHVIFTIREGTPVTIQERSFLTADGQQPLKTLFDESLRRAWAEFRGNTDAQTGERYTEFKRTQSTEEVRTWLRNQGFAFAEVRSEARIDSTANAAALRFLVDPGPLAYVDEIQVDGNESVSKRVVRRELPYEVGDRFSAAEVREGQRRLFDLNLFRVALADVPDQPRDSTVTVRYRVREVPLRSYSGQVGYGTDPGVTLEGSWRHRNFQGDGRTFIVRLVADTGYPKDPPSFFPSFLANSASKEPSRLFRASVTLRQPYLFTDQLSGSVEPFLEESLDPNIGANADRLLGLNERQFGVDTQLLYDILPFRTVSLQHSFALIQQFRSTEPDPRDPTLATGDDVFDKSVFTLGGTFGKADDYINPTRGVLFRPEVQVGGIPFPSGVELVRLNGGLSGYLPLSDRAELAARVSGGVLWPLKESRTNLTAPGTVENRRFQDRFSDFLFYAGGGSDVRGWPSQLAGGKVLRESETLRAGYVYRPVGARSKIGVNLEARLPFPGLGTSWRTALFLDAAYLQTGDLALVPPPSRSDIVAGPAGTSVASDANRLLVGTGGGIRYETPFGFVRLDLAYKLTPDRLDLRRPEDVGETVAENGGRVEAVSERAIRRFRLHFGIGRSF